MFSLPLYIFLFIYIFFLIIFSIFAFINIAHIVQTGSMTFTSFCVTFLTLILTVFVFFATWWLLKDVDWQTQAMVWNSEWIGNLFSSGQFPNM